MVLSKYLYIHSKPQNILLFQARFMADSLYILSMVMTQDITNFLSQEDFEKLEKVAIMICAIHARAFLQSEKIELAPSNDFYLMKELEKLTDSNIPGAKAYCESLKNHAYYLRPELVIVSLFSDKISVSDKEEMAQKLLITEKPKKFKNFCYSSRELQNSTKDIKTKHLKDLVSHDSWFLFTIFDEFDYTWLKHSPETWTQNEHYIQMKEKIRKIVCINDCCERSIKLAQDFISVARIENKFQDALICFKNHRELHPFNNTGHWKKKDLEKMLEYKSMT